MSLKQTSGLVFGLIAAALLAACGGGGSSGGGNSSPTPTYSISGTVSGLSGTLVLQNNGGDDLTLTADGRFNFATSVTNGAAYAVTVLTQPAAQNCSIANGTGTIAAANISDVAVTCSMLDVTAPVTTAAPAVSGTTDTATTLSVTIDENGTGYYLAVPFGTPAPTAAEVQTGGTAFAMTANTAATPTISGLTFNTAYTIYFVAKDAANNLQAAVSSVDVTTLLTAGYVVQGGLTWMPATTTNWWPAANTYCSTTTINGLTGWRLPTQAEFDSLRVSGALAGQGWPTDNYYWSSTPAGAGVLTPTAPDYYVGVQIAYAGPYGMYMTNNLYISCVR